MVDPTSAHLADLAAADGSRRSPTAQRSACRIQLWLFALSLAPFTALQAESTVTNDIRDIRPPVTIPTGWEWLFWILAGTIAFLLLYSLIQLWRREPEPPAPLVIPPHIRARDRLRQALELISEPRPFCISISDTLRLYLEERFQWHAPERTTEEFLDELQASTTLDAEQKQSLGEFLTRCDLVKFARQSPPEPELRRLLDLALRMVEQTIPDPLPASEPPGVPQSSPTQPALP